MDQIAWCLVVLLLYTLGVVMLYPWRHIVNNLIDLVSNATLICVMGLSSYFAADVVKEYGSERQKAIEQAFCAGLLTLTFLPGLPFVFRIAVVFWEEFVHDKRQATAKKISFAYRFRGIVKAFAAQPCENLHQFISKLTAHDYHTLQKVYAIIAAEEFYVQCKGVGHQRLITAPEKTASPEVCSDTDGGLRWAPLTENEKDTIAKVQEVQAALANFDAIKRTFSDGDASGIHGYAPKESFLETCESYGLSKDTGEKVFGVCDVDKRGMVSIEDFEMIASTLAPYMKPEFMKESTKEKQTTCQDVMVQASPDEEIPVHSKQGNAEQAATKLFELQGEQEQLIAEAVRISKQVTPKKSRGRSEL